MTPKPEVNLRPLVESDITEAYAAWFHDESVTRFLESRDLSVSECRAFFREGLRTQRWFMYAIELESAVVGTAKIGPIAHEHQTSDLVTVIGTSSAWGKGVGREAIRLATEIAFTEHGIRKLSGGVCSGNIASIRAYTEAGWVVEGRLRGHYLINGEVQDHVLISCFNPSFFLSRFGD